MSLSEMVLNWSKLPELNLGGCFHIFGQFIVRVLNKEEKDEALDSIIMRALFETNSDPIINALLFDKLSIKSLKRWIYKHLEQNIAYGCFSTAKEGGKKKEIQLVAVDVLYVRNISDNFEPSQDLGEAFVNFITYNKRIEKHVWSEGAQRKCNILSSFGIFISNEFMKNTRIAIEMMKIRKKLATTLKIGIMGAAFIGAEIQAAAEKDLKYDIFCSFTKDHCNELGLGSISQQEYINLMPAFPIIVMGFKQCIKKPKQTVAKVIESTNSKKIKIEEL